MAKILNYKKEQDKNKSNQSTLIPDDITIKILTNQLKTEDLIQKQLQIGHEILKGVSTLQDTTEADHKIQVNLLSELIISNKELHTKINNLKQLLRNNMSYKKLGLLSISFLSFFSISFISEVFFNYTIVQIAFCTFGLVISFVFFLISRFLKKLAKDIK